ncbi:MAG: class I SAM-dependent methyltransferase [Deltaproteobacteria bacterium]|nr:class I SAM-dependent methyltransferase [Deltaproteobacteria bacterium]
MNDQLDNGQFRPEYFEHVHCNLCGAPDSESTIVYPALTTAVPKNEEGLRSMYSSSSHAVIFEQVVRCNRCGLIYISPRPKTELVVGGYSEAEDEQYISQTAGRELTFTNGVKIIQRYCQSGKLLDIGAASGIFVNVAVKAGFDACGIEPAAWMCEQARKNYGVTMYNGILQQVQFLENSFDVITMWDVLEHVTDPMGVLKEIKRILKPGGILLINYPRIDDPVAKLFGRKWWFLLSIHLYYFTPLTLRGYAQRLGFEQVLHKMHIQRLSYGYLVERLKVYSKLLATLAKLLYIIPGWKNFQVPYFASQYLLILKKTGTAKE